jgi:hypothetical protein
MINYRRTIFISVFLLLCFTALAPDRKFLAVEASPPLEPYRKLMHAIALVETKGDTLAWNPIEQAAGIFQIRPIRLLDYNLRTGKNYRRKDLFSKKVSEEIFLYYATRIGPYDFERIARNWNGSGRKTTWYWNKVRKHL